MNVLELINVEKNYGDFKALDKVSFAIKKGSIYGFVGENGAGKTTTMNIICGLTKLSAGEIIFMGKKVKAADIRSDIGYLPQNPKFYDYMTVGEYLDFLIKACGIKNKHYKKELLLSVGLENAVSKYISSLSGGMKQRLGIAAAICNNPKLLILDEPTSALDPEGRREVMSIIKSLKDKGMTIFFSTHLLSDVENLCDYVTILHKGKINKSTSMDELKKEFKAAYYEIAYTGKPKYNEVPDFVSKIEFKDEKMIIKLKNELNYENKLYSFLLSLNIKIISCIKKQFSLEDIFFNIIEEGKMNAV